MKIVLLQPPVQDFYDTEIRLQPVGLCYLKAAVKKYLPEIEVIVRDYHSGFGRKTLPLPRELSYLAEYYPAADKSPFSAFHQYYHFGKSFDAIEDELAEIKPDAVGISSLFTPYFREALEAARRVKRRLGVPVIMGGPHVSGVPESVLASPNVDYVICGEGERPLVELLKYLSGNAALEDVPNLGYKRDDKLKFNKRQDNYHIDELPVPDLSDFTAARYQLAGKPLTSMLTSRGCPHRCSFCSVHTTFGNKYRRRPNDSILMEIEKRYQEGYRVIDFEDDNLAHNRIEFRDLCLRLIDRFPGGELSFTAMNGVSYVSLDEELLEVMFRAGFKHLNLSLVSSDKGVCDAAKRPHSPDAYSRIVQKAFEAGFRIVSYQILGLPHEGLESMVRTLVFNARLPVLIGVSPFYLIPEAPAAQGLHLTEDDFVKARLTAMGIEADAFKREDIYTLFITARIINFLKGLDVPDSAEIAEILNCADCHARERLGIELLNALKSDGSLYFMTSKGRVRNSKFNTDLFLNVLRETGYVTCQNGKRIVVEKFI